jgi:hypothetical protein
VSFAAQEAVGAISYAEALRLARYCVQNRADEDTLQGYDISAEKLGDAADALHELKALVEKITEAVATDERALTLTDPSARSSEQQYAEEEIFSAAVSIAAGFDTTTPPRRER